MSQSPIVPPEPVRNPATHEAFRRQVWFQIYLPLLACIILLAGLSVLLWGANMAGASAWADASLILLSLPVVILSVIPIVFLGFVVYGVAYVTKQIPVPAHQVQQSLAQVQRMTQRAAEKIVQPMVAARAGGAAAKAVSAKLMSMIRRMG